MPADTELPVVCLMGPTASGKTQLALELAEVLHAEIVSVDSALVYRGMDIGTAKPDAATLARYPHRLIDIREPEESYSAGDFVRDATAAIDSIRAAGRLPLLVGGTMLYFRALTRGIARLPGADAALRAALDAEADRSGWPAMHRKLAEVDPQAAERINVNDRQRIQRALEVYRASGRPLSDWQARGRRAAAFRFVKIALVPEPRSELHRRIATRFRSMLEAGFVDEVRRLRQRPGLDAGKPSMRAVGYRQLWAHLEGASRLDDAVDRALAATRQLAKRQLTWLRQEPGTLVLNPLEEDAFGAISAEVARHLQQ